ncbi:MAG TPA: tetratricopeptide repeat protein, partial [Burkholderiaceae bacterium]|nr:tetratricopeptide repeat protein [Burkholderiaceae bacterium]
MYAEMICREQLDDMPNHAELNFWLGAALAAQGKKEEAVAAYEVAIRSNHDHFFALCNLGGLLTNMGRYGEAERLLK